MSGNAAMESMFFKATKAITGTLGALNPFRGEIQTEDQAKAKAKDSKAKEEKAKKEKTAKMAAEDAWPFYTLVDEGDNDEDWALVDSFEAEALEQEAENQADPLNVNVLRNPPPRVDYVQVTWEVLKDFMGGKQQGLRQIGW